MKKRYILFVGIVFFTTSLRSQINIVKEKKSEDEFVNEERVDEFMDVSFSPDVTLARYEAIKKAFKIFDLISIKNKLSEELKSEMDSIQIYFNHYTKVFNAFDNVTHFEEPVYAETGININDKVGVSKFKVQKPEYKSLSIEYTYKWTNPIIIHQIAFVENGKKVATFPRIFKEIEYYQSILRKDRNKGNYEHLIATNLEIISRVEKVKKMKYKSFRDPVNTLAYAYGNNAFYYCLNNQPNEAIASAKKGLKLNRKLTWIATNTVLAHMILDNYEIAEEMYNELKSMKDSRGEPFKQALINDLMKVREMGIEIPSYDKAMKLLNSK